MKELLKPYAEPAKVAMGALSTFLVTSGAYDYGQMAVILGAVGAFATAFWTAYDSFFKKDK